MPATPDELLARLRALGITCKTYDHPPVFTVEESKRLRGRLPGAHCKSLFLEDKAGQSWLVVALEDRKLDLKRLGKELGARSRLSFGSPARLMERLGVTPGAVTPFAVINDAGGRVEVVLDQQMMGCDPLNYHPLTNDRTTAIAPGDLLRFLSACGHEPRILDFDAPSLAAPAATEGGVEGRK